jgi:type I site-specific restriction endonuclease
MISLFLRDVRSQLYFEQVNGHGTRTIEARGTKTRNPLN